MHVKDWIFVAGIVIIFLAAAGSLAEQRKTYGGSRKSTTGITTGYSYAVFDLLCAVNLLECRRGLVNLGVPDGLSWVVAPLGLLVVIVASAVSWGLAYESEHSRWWAWSSALVFYIAAGAGFLAVAAQ
jgi:hypothetical protein